MLSRLYAEAGAADDGPAGAAASGAAAGGEDNPIPPYPSEMVAGAPYPLPLMSLLSWMRPARAPPPPLPPAPPGGGAGGKAPLEVVVVSWDESEGAQREYARGAGMRWRALEFDDRELVDELCLRCAVVL